MGMTLEAEGWPAMRSIVAPLVVGAGCSALTARLRELPRERPQETGVVAQVTPPQAPRLVGQAIGPFQAGLLDPHRCLRHQAGVEIERRAHPDQDRSLEIWTHPRHPLLLLGHADAGPHDVGLG